MSFCTSAIVAASTAVKPPIVATVNIAAGLSTNTPDIRHTRYTPAVTIVAAWISALTGVGPAIASGNQTYSGICALLPAQPRNSARPTRVAALTRRGAFTHSTADWMKDVSRKRSPIHVTQGTSLPTGQT